MIAPLLIVSDRFPSAVGAGAESVLSALCSITAGLGTEVDFLVVESPLIRVNFDRVPPSDGMRLTFLRTLNPLQSGRGITVSRLPNGDPHHLDLKRYQKIFVFGDANIIEFGMVPGNKIAWPDDPPHLVSEFKAGCSLLPLRSRFRSRARAFKERWEQRSLRRALTTYEAIVHHAHHHAREFRQSTGRPVVYAPPLIPSMSELRTFDRGSVPTTQRRGFIHIGHLGGAASLASLEILLSPIVQTHFRSIDEPLVLIGKADIPVGLKSRIVSAGFSLTGFVEDLDAAMRASRAVVVPGNYTVGARTRILHSLTLGTPVVAHRSCLAGIPELERCAAVKLFDSTEELVRVLIAVEGMDQSALEHVSSAATDFMTDFAPKVERKWRQVFDQSVNVTA